MATKRELKYIGLSIEELLEYSAADLKRMDEMKVDKEIRDGYDKFVNGLRKRRARGYVFVYSKYVIIFLEF